MPLLTELAKAWWAALSMNMALLPELWPVSGCVQYSGRGGQSTPPNWDGLEKAISYQRKIKKELTSWHRCHIKYGMKMTMYIDDELLARVMEATGATSKTKAIDLALREMDRKAKLIKLSTVGLGMGPDELKEVIDPAYDLEAMRGSKTPITYGRKPRTR